MKLSQIAIMSHGPSLSFVKNFTVNNSSLGVLHFDGFSVMLEMFSTAHYTFMVSDLTVSDSRYGGYTEAMLITGEVQENCAVVLSKMHFSDLYFEESGSFLIINHDSGKFRF